MIARSSAGRCAAASVAFALLVGACGSGPIETAQPPPPVSPTPSSGAASPDPPATTPAAPPSRLVAIDPALLDLLPDTVAGLAIEASPEAAAESTGDPVLAESAESIAVGIAADPETSSFAVASVVKLRPGVYDDEFFRDWRDSFDAGVCEKAGGVAGNAEAQMGGRTVHIGTCAGGVHTYHAYLDDRDVIVSVNSVGEARLGEELMEELPG